MELSYGVTIAQYLTQAIFEIDLRLGDGYAEKHPGLIAECVRSQTLDFNNCLMVATIWEIRDTLDYLADQLGRERD